MLEKKYFADHKLAQTGRKRYSKSMNFVAFSNIKFAHSSVSKIHAIND